MRRRLPQGRKATSDASATRRLLPHGIAHSDADHSSRLVPDRQGRPSCCSRAYAIPPRDPVGVAPRLVSGLWRVEPNEPMGLTLGNDFVAVPTCMVAIRITAFLPWRAAHCRLGAGGSA